MDRTSRRVSDAILAFGESLDVVTTDTTGLFCPDPEANSFILSSPFAFLLGVVFDQGIVAERAWTAPWELKKRLGHLDPERLSKTPVLEISDAIAKRPALHRYTSNMARYVAEASRRTTERYDGDASQIWLTVTHAQELDLRLREFVGIGQKKAAMAVAILAKVFKVPLEGVEAIDVAYDVHVRRVFRRVGLCVKDDMISVLAAAREAYPAFPGKLDYPAWVIGRQWCRPSKPLCGSCPLASMCPKLIEPGVQRFFQESLWI